MRQAAVIDPPPQISAGRLVTARRTAVRREGGRGRPDHDMAREDRVMPPPAEMPVPAPPAGRPDRGGCSIMTDLVATLPMSPSVPGATICAAGRSRVPDRQISTTRGGCHEHVCRQGRRGSRPRSHVRSPPAGNPVIRPPLPPFPADAAVEKVRLAEDAWNTRDPVRVAVAYSVDSRWRNRAEFVNGREAIEAFLARKWTRELDYRLIKELWAFDGNRIAVRFAYESHDDSGNWFRSYGNENWEFDDDGLMRRRYACINDLPIAESERLFSWPLGRRPDDHPGLSDLGL